MTVKLKRKKSADRSRSLELVRLQSLREDLKVTMLNVAKLSVELERLIEEESRAKNGIRGQDSRHLKRVKELVEVAKKVKKMREADRKRSEVAQDAITLTEIFSMYKAGDCDEYEMTALCGNFIEAEKRKPGVVRSGERGTLKRAFDRTKRHNKNVLPFGMISGQQIAELGGPAKAAGAMLSIQLGTSAEAVDTIRKDAKNDMALTWIPSPSTRDALLHFIGETTGVQNFGPRTITRVLYGGNQRLELGHHQDSDHRGRDTGQSIDAIKENLKNDLEQYRNWRRKTYPEEYEG